MEEHINWDGGLVELVENPVVNFFFQLILAIVVTIFLIIASKIIANMIRNRVVESTLSVWEWDWEWDVYSKRVGNLISSMVFYPLLLISLFVWFQIIWFDIWILLWWLSVGLWFAFKEVLGNMFAWVMLLLTKEIRLWDRVEVEKFSDKSYFGTIEEITIRYTVLRTVAEKRRVIVPNLDMINCPVQTYNSEEFVKMYNFVLIHYDEDINNAINAIKEAINSSSIVVLKEETKVLINKIWDSGWDKSNSINTSNWVELRVVYHIDPNQTTIWPKLIQWKINQIVYKAITENNIRVPYPHSTITVDKNDKNLLWSAVYLMNKKQNNW